MRSTDTGRGPLRGFGVCTHLERRNIGWKAEALVPLIRDMGASMVRQGIGWGNVERAKGAYEIPEVRRDWVDRVAEAGMGIILILCYGNGLYDAPLAANDDEWQRNAEPVERYVQITGPQVRWFAAGDTSLAFVWKAGRLDAECNPPLGRMVWPGAPSSCSVEIENVATGARVPAAVTREGGTLVLDELPVSGEMLAVRWRV